ncbi:hypothetical protein RIF29_03960 [Crotalaria pallida]|uniref:Tubulin/FtsZ 2-layer sandwich domain-containing protein n=1 Tax=Crotalaria pallida TaxID=3830 RepID=A0AAN9J1G1_CROPI
MKPPKYKVKTKGGVKGSRKEAAHEKSTKREPSHWEDDVMEGLVNVDFADVRTIMANAGSSLLGIGTATGLQGKSRARDAALNAIQSPLLDIGIERATGINMTCYITNGFRLIKESDREIKDEEGRNPQEVNKQLNDEKQSMIKELNSYVALRKMYMNTLGNKKAELFNMDGGVGEPTAEENVRMASGLLKKNCQSTLVVDSTVAAEGNELKDNVEKLELSKSVI